MLVPSDIVELPVASPRPVVRALGGGKFARVGALPCGLDEPVVRVAGGFVAFSEPRDHVRLFEWDGVDVVETLSAPLPGALRGLDAALIGRVLYIGGYEDDVTDAPVLLRWTPVDGASRDWHPVAIPREYTRHGKRIDALLVDGDSLIAVDDRILPKCFLIYDVANPTAPALARHPKLVHGPNEQAERAALGSEFIAVLSSSVTTGGFWRAVTLYDRASFEELGYLGSGHGWEKDSSRQVSLGTGRGSGLRSNSEWHDLAFVGDTLLVAAGTQGLGIVRTRGIGPELRRRKQEERERMPDPKIVEWDPVTRIARRLPREEALAAWRILPPRLNEATTFWPPRAGGAVVAVAAAGENLGAFVVTDRGGQRELFWFDAADGTVTGPLELP